MTMNGKKTALATILKELLIIADGKEISMDIVLKKLAGKGQAILLILLSIPFCLPIQIPGFSTPFGIILSIIGLRIATSNYINIPEFIAKKTISYKILRKLINSALKISGKIQSFIFPRLITLTSKTIFKTAHGLTIFILGILLALPLPIPFTNFFAAYPLLCFGLGLLEDDGLFIIIAYFLSIICFSYFFAIYWFGKEGIKTLFT